MRTEDIPEELRPYAGRGGWHVGQLSTWCAWRVINLFTANVLITLTPGDQLKDDWWLEILLDNSTIMGAQGDKTDCLKQVDRAREHLATVCELRNIHLQAQLREAIGGLPAWALKAACRDLGVSGRYSGDGRYSTWARDQIVDRILNPPRA